MMGTPAMKLPSGYKLDEPAQQINLPAGYSLDEPQGTSSFRVTSGGEELENAKPQDANEAYPIKSGQFGSGESMRAPDGLLEKAQGWIQGNAPDWVNSVLRNIPKLGSAFGFDQPMSAYAPADEILGAAGNAIGKVASKPVQFVKDVQAAKEFKNELPIIRRDLAYNSGVKRTGFQADKEAADAATRTSNAAQLTEQTAPLQSEADTLRLANRQTGSSLTNESANQSIINARSKQVLQSQAEQAQNKVAGQAAQSAQSFQRVAGERINPIEFAQRAPAARAKAMGELDSQISDVKKKLLDIPERPENFATQSKTVETGKKMVGDAGWIPETKTIQSQAPMEVDLSKAQSGLTKQYDSISGNVRTVASQGSPGAQALVDFYEHEGTLTLDQALELRASLNKIGWHDADTALVDRSKALARTTAQRLNQSIQSYFDKLPSGGDEAKGFLEQFRQLSEKKGDIFKNPIARQAANTMTHGDATKLTDPVVLDSWMKQVDDPTRIGAKAQVTHDLTADPNKFPSKWNSMNPDIKSQWYSPEEIQRGDSIANMGSKQIDAVADKYNAVEKQRALDTVGKSASITKRRAELSQIQTNIDEINSKIENAGIVQKAKLNAELASNKNEYLQKSAKLKYDVNEQSKELIRQSQAADAKIAHMRRIKYGAGIIGLSAAGSIIGSKARAIFHTILGQ